MLPSSCPICRLHADHSLAAAMEIARSDLWLLRHHPLPAPVPDWLLLDARRHLGGPLALTDQEAASRLVQE